jgi:2-methylcitrate synthase
VAGNTALCTVGRTGNDLHYRGYDILDIAEACEFEEIAHLLVHGKLPTREELAAYKRKLVAARPARPVASGARTVAAGAHPMDVLRTGVSALGCVLPEKDDHNLAGARDIADRLMASLGSMLCTGITTATTAGASKSRPTMIRSAAISCICCTARSPKPSWVKAMHTSLILYAEHEFNASTFAARVIAGTGSDMYSAITGAIGALRGPKHGGANEVAFEIQKRYETPDEAEADIRSRVANKEVIIGFGHPVYTISDPRNQVIKEVAKKLSARRQRSKMFDIAERLETVMWDDQEDVSQSRLVQRRQLSHDGRADRDVYAAVRDCAHLRLERTCDRAAHRRQDHPPERQLHRAGGAQKFIPLGERRVSGSCQSCQPRF